MVTILLKHTNSRTWVTNDSRLEVLRKLANLLAEDKHGLLHLRQRTEGFDSVDVVKEADIVIDPNSMCFVLRSHFDDRGGQVAVRFKSGVEYHSFEQVRALFMDNYLGKSHAGS